MSIDRWLIPTRKLFLERIAQPKGRLNIMWPVELTSISFVCLRRKTKQRHIHQREFLALVDNFSLGFAMIAND